MRFAASTTSLSRRRRPCGSIPMCSPGSGPRVRVTSPASTPFCGVRCWSHSNSESVAMPIDIDALTESELMDLNHRVVARLRFLAHVDAHATMLEFRIGERVTFHPDGRPPVTGMISRYNKKTVGIVTDDGHRWNVAPQLLQRAAPRALVKPDAGNVIEISRKNKPSL